MANCATGGCLVGKHSSSDSASFKAGYSMWRQTEQLPVVDFQGESRSVWGVGAYPQVGRAVQHHSGVPFVCAAQQGDGADTQGIVPGFSSAPPSVFQYPWTLVTGCTCVA